MLPRTTAVWIYPAPLIGDVELTDFSTKLVGDPGEGADQVRSGADLDGDGLDEVIVGAYYSGSTGRVAPVSEPPPGEHRVWDVAFATVDGIEPEGQTGLGLTPGDLDGDGHVDLLVGAPIALDGSGVAYVMSGPFQRSTSVAEATVTVRGTLPLEWAGYDGAIGDLDGDGAADLVVGAPQSIYFGTDPGQVAVFPDPEPGVYEVPDAPILLNSGSTEPDGFGISIAPGDLDGDGLLDLAIGAPNDSRSAPYAGSVTLVFGASL